MQVIVTVKRITEYSSIVEMTLEKYNQILADLDSSDRRVRAAAEKQANALIDTKDWQDDELHSVEDFKPLEEDAKDKQNKA